MPIYAVTVSRTLPTDARPFVDHLARRPKRYAASSTRQLSAAVSDDGPFQPRGLSAFVSAIGGLAAAPAVLSARQLMTDMRATKAVLARRYDVVRNCGNRTSFS